MLRNYQETAVAASVNFFKYRRPLHGYVTAPGGSGKSHMIAALAERVLALGVGRVLVLTRSERLLTQNRSKFSAPYQVGAYCAGLGERDLSRPITIATAQSLAGEILDGIALIIVDECDEISDDEESQYQVIFNGCDNPPVIGFTATAFRTNSGGISWGEEIVNIPLKPLMNLGHLTRPTNKVGTTLDLSQVEIRIGEYVQSQLDEVFKNPELLALSIKKIKQYSAERSSCLIFAQSIAHADLLANAMEYNSMPAVIVTGDTDKEELGFILHDFEEGRIKYLINVMLLTRGYDMPCVDMIAVLRATKSKRLWEQILYRGTRLKEGKVNFLVLDMGNNFITHGPLGSPYVGATGKKRGPSQGKICPECEDFTPPLSKDCPECGYIFPSMEARAVSHSSHSDSTSPTIYDASQPYSTYTVTGVSYKKHVSKKSKGESLMLSYHCSYGKYGNIAEWYFPKSDWDKGKTAKMFKERGHELMSPASTYSWDDLLWHCDFLAVPIEITVDHKTEFPRIVSCRYQTAEDVEAYLNDEIGY